MFWIDPWLNSIVVERIVDTRCFATNNEYPHLWPPLTYLARCLLEVIERKRCLKNGNVTVSIQKGLREAVMIPDDNQNATVPFEKRYISPMDKLLRSDGYNMNHIFSYECHLEST